MTWPRERMRHSVASRKGWRKRRLKEDIKEGVKEAGKHLIKKGITTAAGVPDISDVEVTDERISQCLRKASEER